ncbi:hypothetical protein AMTR_s00074p00150910 [Amborella trichopoda]|uniref:Uncharacterized protein n=1 Tax=Amborella trichopoda TaxID=13333 RepID=W1NMY3_AMBTC|nr:hypothetical protein AMTR_s00074p00150910 [Amborella trichopoda]
MCGELFALFVFQEGPCLFLWLVQLPLSLIGRLKGKPLFLLEAPFLISLLKAPPFQTSNGPWFPDRESFTLVTIPRKFPSNFGARSSLALRGEPSVLKAFGEPTCCMEDSSVSTLVTSLRDPAPSRESSPCCTETLWVANPTADCQDRYSDVPTEAVDITSRFVPLTLVFSLPVDRLISKPTPLSPINSLPSHNLFLPV